MCQVQETSSLIRVGFALSKWPHFHRVYLVTVRKQSSMAVYGRSFTIDSFFQYSTSFKWAWGKMGCEQISNACKLGSICFNEGAAKKPSPPSACYITGEQR